ncbi:MAG: DUF1800 domain-containing protein [Chitinophagales bacterium]
MNTQLLTNCASSSLTPYTPNEANPWNRKKAMHLLRRMGFGASHQQIEAALTVNPLHLVDQILIDALQQPLPTAPSWKDWTVTDYQTNMDALQEHILEWNTRWLTDMAANGFRERLALFWHNHFVTQLEVYVCPPQMYSYHKLLQQYALGNFKTFTYEMGKTPAMLVYLNGIQNDKNQPNENYARELYELFTLGQDKGYTQTDIAETARALTGWVVPVGCSESVFFAPRHDNGIKTIFGQTGNWGYDELHDILFEQRSDEIAVHICTKIYKHFVGVEVNETVANGLAKTFKDNNFELAPVFYQLFQSEHFFDEANAGTQIKSPLVHLISFLNDANFTYGADIVQFLGYGAGGLGQQLFNPVDVAGWPGDKAWITTATLTARWQYIQAYIGYVYETYPTELVNFAKQLSGNSNDPALISRKIVNHFVVNGLQTEEEYNIATTVFKFEVPQNYFDDGSWNLDWPYVEVMVALLLIHISQLPEFQLA